MKFEITSDAFENDGIIPSRFTCDAENISPALRWSQGPEKTQSYVLISDDPDAPVGAWVHWVIFNLPAEVTWLAEKVPPTETLSGGGIHGKNDFKKLGYGGPCPPYGMHRYFFKIYALDTKLDLKAGASKKEVEQAMKNHVLAQGELMAKYQRNKNRSGGVS